MRFPTMFRYGARAVTYLAAVYPDRVVSVREVGQQQGISLKYLEHILRALKAAGIVQAIHGKQGGYMLSRPPADITLKDLYESLAGPLAPVHCIEHPSTCPRYDSCPTRETWAEVKTAIERVLEQTTAQDLVERKDRATSPELMYQV